MFSDLTTAAATGTAFNVPAWGMYGIGGKGTWGSGTLKLQMSVNGADFYDVPNAGFTADGAKLIELARGAYRWILTGSTGAAVRGQISL